MIDSTMQQASLYSQIMERSFIQESLVISLLEPLRTQTTFFPMISSFISQSPETAKAPAGSRIIASSSYISSMVFEIKPSSTNQRLNFVSFRMSQTIKIESTKVRRPVVLIAPPSAKVYKESRIIGLPSLRELYIEGDPKGQNPKSCVSGAICFRQLIMPAARPPPPTHVNTQSRCCLFLSQSQRIQAAIPPCPQITLG